MTQRQTYIPFYEAFRGLLAGDFTRLDCLFSADEDNNCPILQWYDSRLFDLEPAALKEAFTCACFNGRIEVVERLLRDGIDPAGGMATGLNAFHWAANRGQLEIVRMLICYHAPMETLNSYGGTVLECAVWSAIHEPKPAHPEIVEALLRAGAQITKRAFPCGDQRIDKILRRYVT